MKRFDTTAFDANEEVRRTSQIKKAKQRWRVQEKIRRKKMDRQANPVENDKSVIIIIIVIKERKKKKKRKTKRIVTRKRKHPKSDDKFEISK